MGQLLRFSSLQLILGLTILSSFSAQSLSQSRENNLDPEIEKALNDFILGYYLPANQINGLGLSIIRNNGEVFYTNGYGIGDVQNQLPVTSDTQFFVGSISKSFTALALIKALHENFPALGESVLDTPIRELVPQANFTMIDRFRSEHGNVRDLLSHRMCFARPETDWPQMAESVDSRDELIYRQRYVEEMCGMRTLLQYSNQMVVIAGDLLAHLTNKRYEDAMTDFLTEIGMTNTVIFNGDNDLPLRAKPYYVKNETVHPVNPGLLRRILVSNPAGGVISSPNDMTKYMQFYLDLGKVDGKQVIPEDVMKWMTKPAMFAHGFDLPANKFAMKFNAYGLAMILATFKGSEYFLHTGYFTPYSSQVSWFPEENLGIFTTTNYGPVEINQLVLHAFIHELVAGNLNATEKAVEFAQVMKAQEDAEKQKDYSQSLESFFEKSRTFNAGKKPKAEEVVGKYGSGGGGDAEVLEQWNDETNQNELFIKYGKWAHGWLDYVTGASYKIRFVTDLGHDDYALGLPDTTVHVHFYNETMEFTGYVRGYGEKSYGEFTLGVSLDKLPPIPWLPGSCGPE